MSIFTVAEVNEIIDTLKCQLIADPMGTIGSVSIGGRTVSYKSADELEKIVTFWEGQLSRATASAAGRSGTNPKVARFV